jgi:hypothetical protein
VLFGVGVDPDDVFGAVESVREIARARVDLAALFALKPTTTAPAAVALRPFRRLELLFERAGPRALAGELVLALAGDPKPRSVDLSAFDWPSAPPGDRVCSQRYAEALVAALRAPQARPPVGDEAARRLAAFEAAASCLEGHPALAASAAELRRLLPQVYADGLAPQLLYADAVRALDPACARGDAEACARQTELRAAPSPRLPEVARAPCDFGYPLAANYNITVTPAGLALDGVELADPAALRGAIAAAVADLPANEYRSFGLAVDRDMPFGSVHPALAALRGFGGAAGYFAAFRGPDGELHQLPITLEPMPDRTGEPTLIALGAAPATSAPPGPIDNLQVSAKDTVAWSEVAAALSRSCSLPLLLLPDTGPKAAPKSR